MDIAATIQLTAGGIGSGCRGDHCGRPQTKSEAKSARAKASYVPVTPEKAQKAKQNEESVAKAVKGDSTWFAKINPPFDVLIGKNIGIEVKTIFPGVKNDKVTVHPESMQRKIAEAKKLGLKKTYMVVVDERTNKVYYRDKIASFRLRHMIEVGSIAALRKVIK